MTIHRRLIERNLLSYRLLSHLSLTPAHCQARSQWCLARPGWNHVEWGSIMFREESLIQLCPDDHRRRVLRRPVQHANPAFTIARYSDPQPGVMAWAAISFDIRIPLVVIRGTLPTQRYVEDILKLYCYCSL
ncbi:transposable element Tc1 transposase [Trichonephila clavipes]|nr:transposable element Tc1 transposase [Trichonephila clavipes]